MWTSRFKGDRFLRARVELSTARATLLSLSYSNADLKPFARKGARVADTPADAARDADLVMYSLSNDQF
jgi:3-hydroxyisobutyrate dehydrogenase-like beta-hydroxyacid dehydrogenase